MEEGSKEAGRRTVMEEKAQRAVRGIKTRDVLSLKSQQLVVVFLRINVDVAFGK